MTVRRREVDERPKTYAKRDVKVGKLDMTELERETIELSRPYERITKPIDRESELRGKKPKKEKIDQYRPQGEEFDKAYTYDYKSRTDDTEITQQRVTAEKITVSREDRTQIEETEKPRYPKDLDIGRIVIKEAPEEKEEILKRDVVRRDEVKPRREDMKTPYEAEKVPGVQMREEIIKVGKLDVTEYEKTQKDSERTYVERLRKDQKPKYDKKKEERIDHYRPQGEEFDKAYTYDYKSRTDDTEITQQRVTAEKITVSREDRTQIEETEKPRYPKDLDIGRIVIEEAPEEKEEILKREVVRRDEKEIIKVGKLDVTDYEKTQKDSERTYVERLRKDQKPRYDKKKEERIDHYRPQGEEFDKAYTYDYKSRKDDSEITQQRVTAEKITVSTEDRTQIEETEKPRYPKDLDIGRIVIEEAPEEKEEILKRDVVRRDEVKPRREDMKTPYQAQKVPGVQVKEEVIKIGKLDVTDYERTRKDEIQIVESPRKVRKDLKPGKSTVELSQVSDVDFEKLSEFKPCADEIPRQQVATERVVVSRRDLKPSEKPEKPKYKKDPDIGRIVIEEIPEKEETREREIVQKEPVDPKKIDMTVRRREVDERPKTYAKRDVKVGKLDMIELERETIELSRPYERITKPIDRESELRGKKPKKEKIDQYRPQGEEFDKAYTYDYKSRTDDTEITQQRVTAEKITVSREDRTQIEETEKPRYPKDLDIGRIVIEEAPEEKEEILKRDVVRRDEVKPRREDMKTPYEAEKVPGVQMREEIIRVGKLDVTEYEKTQKDSERTYVERLRKDQKPKYEKKKEERIDHYRPQGEEFDKAYTYDYKSRTDDTEITQQRVTAEKITVSREDMTQIEETEKPRYPKDLDIGRIVIEEAPEEKEEILKRDVVRTDEVKPRREDMKTPYPAQKVPGVQVKEEVIKIGKLDVTDYERTRKDEIQIVESPRKVRKDLKPGKSTVELSQVSDIDFEKLSEFKPCADEIPRQQVTTERVVVSRRDLKPSEKPEKPKYKKDPEIGRIVIEEIPEKEETREREIVQKEPVDPKKIDMTVRRREVDERPKTYAKRDVKVGKLDMTELERETIELSRPYERITKPIDRESELRGKKPKKEKIDQYRPQGEEFDKAYTYDYKSRTDDTEITQQRVTAEKITVSREDRTQIEETEKPRYPKDLDIGRIVIKEAPEEKEEILKRDVVRRDEVKPRREDMKTPYEAEKVPGVQMREEIIKVGKLDVTEYEKTQKDSERTYVERLRKDQKPKYDKKKEERIDHYRPQGEEFDKAYTYDYKSRTDDTEITQQRVTAEKITVSREDRTQIEETEKPRYPKDLDIGRIVIEEAPEEKEEILKREVVRRDEVKPRREDMKTTYEAEKVPGVQMRKEIIKVGKLDVTDYEKTQKDSERTYVERLRKDQKPRYDKKKEERIDHYRPQGEEFDKAYTYDYKSRKDDSEITQQRVTAEKITVSTEDRTQIEETEKPRYPKDLILDVL
ncbi:trichohyalin-like [Dendronephthya gigantea]|uniref:trichohyalin-like n=1 Tax=Dendronephthya gigantea TaxID=151771 RepID=UPI00106A7DEA|nr:trichohyalin-like [Dendronephthya gigantea]